VASRSPGRRALLQGVLAGFLLAAPPALLAQYQQSAPAAAPASPDLSPEAAARLAREDELASAIVKADAKRVAAWIRTHRELDFNFNDVTRGRTHQSPLTLAIGRNHVEVAGMLLDAGAAINRADGDGRAAIHYARSPEAVRLLAQRGADLNAQDRYGRTAAANAIERGDTGAADGLIASGARLDAPLKGTDLLTRAAESRRPEAIAALLDRGVDPRKPPNRALWIVIDNGDTASALLLIRKGADVNFSDSRGETLLTRALFRQRWEVAEALVNAGAAVKPQDAKGCRHGSYTCQSIQPARLATFNPAMLAKLTAKGLDVNTVAADGHSALTSIIEDQPMAIRAVSAGVNAVGVGRNPVTGEVVATTSSRPERVTEIPAPDNAARVKVLLDARADSNLKYRDATPLMLAIALPGKPPAMVDALLRAGGRIESEAVLVRADSSNPASGEIGARTIAVSDGIVTGMSVGPLTWALFRDRPDIAVRLLERDRRVTRADRHLLYFAAASGKWDLLMSALPYTREVNAANRADVTPLMHAALAGRADAVRALLAAGANVNTRSARIWPPPGDPDYVGFSLGALSGHGMRLPTLVGGYTALRAAREAGHTEIAGILREAGGRE
jgi:ankyrin repeat protein